MSAAMRRQNLLPGDWGVARMNEAFYAVALTRAEIELKQEFVASDFKNAKALAKMTKRSPCKVRVIPEPATPVNVNILNDAHNHETHIHEVGNDDFSDEDRELIRDAFQQQSVASDRLESKVDHLAVQRQSGASNEGEGYRDKDWKRMREVGR